MLQELTRQGLIRADALGLGLDVDHHSRTLNRHGQPNARLFVVGPAARGRFGELMGLPQVADHAAAIAGETLATLGFSLSLTLSDVPLPPPEHSTS